MREPPLKIEWYEWDVWEPALSKPGEIIFLQIFETLPRSLKDEKKKEPSQVFKSILIPETQWFSEKPENHQTLVNSMTTKGSFQ
jgi:hypothetical protein